MSSSGWRSDWMSDADRPDLAALTDLEEVVSRLTDELAAWRRRALGAERERAIHGATTDAVAGRERVVELETRNGELVKRLDAATERLRAILARLAFLEEQAAQGESAR